MPNISLVLLLACQGEAPEPPSYALGDGPLPVEVLPPTLHLTRASVALRGHRPSLDELDQVAADPDALPALVDAWLDSPALGPAIRDMHGTWLLTDTFTDYFPAGFPAQGALRDVSAERINVAVSEAPARLAEHVVVNDLPYATLVTADFTMANDITSVVWGLPYAGDGEWLPTDFGDDRPAAGLLSDHWLFVRHPSTDANRQRARAAHVARAFLCQDYMRREVRVPEGVSLTDGGRDAIRENAVCVSCHQSLDPLGAFFAPHEGVLVPGYAGRYPYQTWDDSRYADYDPPSYYGAPGRDLADLGAFISEDPRFERCAVRRFYAALNAVDADAVSEETIDRWLPSFSGQQVKPLLRDIVLSSEFAAARPTEDASGAALLQVNALRRATPWQIATTVEELTGFQWRSELTEAMGPIDLMRNLTYGFRLHAGGADGQDIWEPQRTATPTTLLVLRSVAALAAPMVVEADLRGGAPRLLTEVDPEATDEAAVRAQLARLHLRLFGEQVDADGPEVDASWAVFYGALGFAQDPEEAWTLTLYALLQDPRILYY